MKKRNILYFTYPLMLSSMLHAETFVGLYTGQGIDANLIQIPNMLVHNTVPYEASHFAAVSFARESDEPSFLGLSVGYEIIAAKHWGLQNHYEISLPLQIWSPWMRLGLVELKGGAGMGFSYALGTPSYEDGPKEDPQRHYRFQSYNNYDLQGRFSRYDDISLVVRIHHRSGIYGLIAPQNVGSNFLTIGLKVCF